MQLICGLLGHRPSPLRALLAWKVPAPCIYCRQPLVRRPQWELAGERAEINPPQGGETALTSSSA